MVRRTLSRTHIVTAVVVTVLLFGAGGWYVAQLGSEASGSQMTDGSPRAQLQLGDGEFRARVVASAAERQQGLSGTRELKPSDAMLFVFPHDSAWGIWMKDMYVPIDIVWLDASKRAVWVKESVQPDSYPETYAPEQAARYVVELPAGTVQRQSIKVGAQAEFSAPERGEV